MPGPHKIPPVLTRDQVRDVDRRALADYGIPGVVLMENAGRNTAQLLQSLGISGRVVVCCGKGNNAGDGFVIARHLENAGVDVRVLLCADANTITGDAATNLHVIQCAKTPLVTPPIDWKSELAAADWIVDALLGTGTRGTIREPFCSAIAAINDARRKVLAVDLPSGMDCDTGQPLGCCIRADHTATFVARKPGFDLPAGQTWTGQVHVIDIGVPIRLLQECVKETDPGQRGQD